AGLRRGHAHDAEERVEVDLAAALVATDAPLDVELPAEEDTVRDEPEPVVEWRRPVARRAPSPCPPHPAVDPDLEHLTGFRSPDLDRPDERVTVVELFVARLELDARLDVPAGVERRERDRVARVDRQHGLEVAREVSVERAPLERELVQRHEASD